MGVFSKMRTILVILILSYIHFLDSSGIEDREARKRPKGCKNKWTKKPKWFKPEKSKIVDCTKFTCKKINWKTFEWMETKAPLCCSYDQKLYPRDSVLTSIVLPDQCTSVSLKCIKKEAKSEMELVVKDSCPPPKAIMNVITEAPATIKSYGFPKPFPPKQDECWMRTPACGHFIHLHFTDFNVLGRDAYVTIDPPVDGKSKYFGNSFNSNRAPPKTIDFPLDYAVKVCFHSGSVVDGHKGFKVELTEEPNTFWVTSPNYPVITGENFEDPPKHGYGPALHYCTVRAPPRKGGALEMEFYQFDINAPPQADGDWITIHPNPTLMPKYYGVNLKEPEAPPRFFRFLKDQLVSICFYTRGKVEGDHKGYVAEIYPCTDMTTQVQTTDYNSEYPASSYPEYPSSYYYNYYDQGKRGRQNRTKDEDRT